MRWDEIERMMIGGGENLKSCLDSPHSLWMTAATILLDAGVEIRKGQGLFRHRHITAT